MVAASTRVHILVVQKFGLAAAVSVSCVFARQSRVRVALRIDGRDIVAAVGVVVQYWLPLNVVGGNTLGKGLGNETIFSGDKLHGDGSSSSNESEASEAVHGE